MRRPVRCGATLVAIALVGLPSPVSGQSTDGAVSGKPPRWVAQYRSPFSDSSQGTPSSYSYAIGVASAPSDGRVFVTGSSQGSETSERDMVSIGYDAATGSRLWVDRFIDAKRGPEAVGMAITVSPSGRRVFATGTSPVRNGVWVTIAYRARTGHRLWVRHFSGPAGSADQAPTAVVLSPNGRRLFVVGGIHRSGGGSEFAIVSYRSATGRRLWTATYHGFHRNGNDSVVAVAIDNRGDRLYATGASRGQGSSVNPTFHTSFPNIDYATLAYDAHTGRRLWTARFNDAGNGGDFPVGLRLGPRGNRVYVTGNTDLSLNKPSSAATISYQADDGHRLWIARYRKPGAVSAASDLSVSPGGRYVFIAGAASAYDPYSLCDPQYSDCDFLTVAYRARTGTQVWARRYATNGRELESAGAVAASPDGKTVYVSGDSGSPEQGISDYVSIAYQAGTGRRRWLGRYNSASDGTDSDSVRSTFLGNNGHRLYVTGVFQSCEQATLLDSGSCSGSFGTVAYRL